MLKSPAIPPKASLDLLGTNPDPHRLRATKLFGVTYEDVTPAQRAFAKAESFMRLYSGE